MITSATARSWHRIREALLSAKERAGLAQDVIVRRCRISRTTIRNLEAGSAYSRIDTCLAYAHAVGLELAAVSPHHARMLDLDRDEVVSLLRAAQAAADGHRLNPVHARRINDILTKVLPRPEGGT